MTAGDGLRTGDTWDTTLGGVRLMSGQCSTCIGRRGNPMRLAPGRVAEIVATNREHGTYLVCHKTLREVSGRGEALCRWFYDLPRPTRFIQVGRRLKWFREVDPGPYEDDDR